MFLLGHSRLPQSVTSIGQGTNFSLRQDIPSSWRLVSAGLGRFNCFLCATLVTDCWRLFGLTVSAPEIGTSRDYGARVVESPPPPNFSEEIKTREESLQPASPPPPTRPLGKMLRRPCRDIQLRALAGVLYYVLEKPL